MKKQSGISINTILIPVLAIIVALVMCACTSNCANGVCAR